MLPAGSARILGLDPGSLRTGFGVIDCAGGTLTIVAQGCIATSGGPLADRLRIIHSKVAEIIQLHSPQEIAVERVFLSKNADSALKLGQARGAAHMVKQLLRVNLKLAADAADALAIAICHAHTRRLEPLLDGIGA
jgi:crossover junction endodeoxyribonuclease RuvC